MALTLDPAHLERIRAWQRRDVGTRYRGSAVLLVQNGDEAFFHAQGEARNGVPWARDTIVRIYSMTKPMVSLVAMQLVEEGAFHLDAPVSRFLPGWEAMRTLAGEPVPAPTLHQLLTHTSGLSYAFNPGPLGPVYGRAGVDFGPGGGKAGDGVGEGAAVGATDRGGDLAAMCARLAAQPLAFRPGTAGEYSVGIDVVGRVIEVVTGKRLDAVMTARVFEPLGLTDTAFHVPDAKLDRLADCFAWTPDDPTAPYDAGADSMFREGRVRLHSGGGGLLSTIDDVARFAACLAGRGERLVSPSTLAFMRANHLPGDIASMGTASFAEMPMRGMGFGIGGACVLDAGRMGVPGSVGDFGWGGMASTYFWCDPVHAIECVFLAQLVPSSAHPNRAELKALVHGSLK